MRSMRPSPRSEMVLRLDPITNQRIARVAKARGISKNELLSRLAAAYLVERVQPTVDRQIRRSERAAEVLRRRHAAEKARVARGEG